LAKIDTASWQYVEVNLMTRTALVTGANCGIGLETARQLARRRFHVVIAARDEASGSQAAKEIEASEGIATFLLLDVSDSQSIREAANRFARISDRLDVLINNAGIYPDEGVTIATVPRSIMVQTFQTNTFGSLEVAQAFLP
jgi:NAD(P)-dependent dehydrogenase (short-subunit alcohol dehydrogenase family)